MLKKAAEEAGKMKHFEKASKNLEETIKAKHPAQTTVDPATAQANSSEGEKQLRNRIKSLEGELQDRDKDFERRLRGLRQELDRQK